MPWLFKSEPSTWSWEQQLAVGEAGEEWDGVRNYGARNNMRAMEVGERGFFYHSQTDKAVVGIVEVSEAAAPDSTDATGKWECVHIRAVAPLPRPVTLAEIRAEPALSEMALVKNSRLSVQPVTDEEFAVVCRMAGL